MRSSSLRLLAFLGRFAVLGLALAFVFSLVSPALVERLRDAFSRAPAATAPAAAGAATNGRSRGPVSYADAVSRASPAVVNIYANKITPYRQLQPRVVLDPLTQRLLGTYSMGPLMQRRDQSLGSGVIFSTDGYVLTNNHVISGADDIQVLLDDDRVAKARVIGTDAETDLAVLKIDVGNLPAIAVADGAEASVGDVVLAIGNPVGIGKTVTMGIVSGTGRQLRLSSYEDFIQTDAAINAGNSGGALVNALGELIGINTAMYPRTPTRDGRGSVTPGAEGIGFAIPVATARNVLDQIVRHGVVVRGWLGVDYADIPIANGASVARPGAVVLNVYPNGPAAAAGIRAGDLLLKLDGRDIVDQTDLLNREAALAPGTRVKLECLRGGRPMTFELALAQRPTPGTTGT
ncbi:S1C family serine protease [Dokdonella koreensis]|uniref:Trypsin-like serine protease with C-terminal PDZ domain n=1 Tax=Dokdonella koreensis DS-123 TaxID=1300342 RepID=A0A160DV62_9GAMM|nr:trypsin-like peptidase domain-containing protein [Dokdonella koreensis]ANB18399.1 Trypsin-like serine protease with C-terminal PDZ domain [Dokdonella koreensis DS-123]